MRVDRRGEKKSAAKQGRPLVLCIRAAHVYLEVNVRAIASAWAVAHGTQYRCRRASTPRVLIGAYTLT